VVSFRRLNYKANFRMRYENRCLFCERLLVAGSEAYIVEGKPRDRSRRYHYLFACAECGEARRLA
jgi:uncharacterized protein with PIN domain